MKALLLSLSFLALFITAHTQPRFSFGLKAGANTSLFYESRMIETDGPVFLTFNETAFWLAGRQAGATAAYHFTPQWSLALEVLYAEKGYRTRQDPWIAGTSDAKTRYKYLSFPLLARFHPLPFLYLEAGVETAYLHSAIIQFGESNFDLKEAISLRDVDGGLAAGIGFTIKERLHLQARYVHGLVNVFDFSNIKVVDINGEPLEGETPKFVHRSLQFSLAMDLLRW